MKALLWFPAPVQSLDWSWALLWRAAPIQLLDWSWMKDFSGVRHSPVTGWELGEALLWCAAPVQLGQGGGLTTLTRPGISFQKMEFLEFLEFCCENWTGILFQRMEFLELMELRCVFAYFIRN